MPAVPAALAQIEERLQEIRYRLNLRTLLAVLCPISAALCVLVSLLIWSAARATPEAFTLSVWATLGASLLVLFRAAMALSQRWLSLSQTARLTDDRAGMQDRLTTLFWLHRSGARPSLTPVLAADAIDRSAAWSAASIVPRRFPYELGYALAGIAALVAMLIYVRLVPPLIMPLPKPGPAPVQKSEKEELPPPLGGDDDPKKKPEGTDPLLAFDVSFDADSAGGGEGAEKADENALTEQLRKAIKRAVGRPETEGDSKAESRGSLSAVKLDGAVEGGESEGRRPRGDSGANELQLPEGERDEEAGDSGLARKPGKPGQDAQENLGRGERAPKGENDKTPDRRRAVEGDPHDGERKNEKLPSMPGSQPPPETADGKGKPGPSSEEEANQDKPPSKLSNAGESKDTRPRSLPNDPEGRGTRPGGGNPVAGPGTAPDGLFAPQGSAGTKVTRAPSAGTFKLTLGSFLAGAPGTSEKKGKQGDGLGGSASARESVSEPPSLHPNQTADDAMRRADVPPEYEDIVRRIYSARPPAK